MYRSIEVQTVVGHETFGEMKASEVTRQLAYALYEQNVLLRGHDFANKAMSAWVAAFRYGLLKLPEITSNPFGPRQVVFSSATTTLDRPATRQFYKKSRRARLPVCWAMRPFVYGT